jgi:integrase
MARLVRDAKLETRTARTRLPIGPKPYFRRLEVGFHLGYRRLSNGGTWIARRFAEDSRYREFRLGLADDTQDADGVCVLDYAQAQKVARDWWRAELRREEGHDTRTGPFTVADAIADYLKALERRGSKGVRESKYKADVHILPALGSMQAAKLTAKRIEDWHRGLAEKPALARSKAGKKPNHRKTDKSADGIRRRRATANRVMTVLKAALNHAWRAGHVASDDSWRRVRPFKAVEMARVRYLSEAECTRLVNACEPTFRNLVRGALLSGCRYSELGALHTADFNADAGVVTIRESKAGKPRHVVLTAEGQRLFNRLTAGTLSDDLIFRNEGRIWRALERERERLKRDGKSPDGAKVNDTGEWRAAEQVRLMADACKQAKITPAVSFHVLRHTHASTLAMRGVPMGVIAEQLGHADTRMTEKHYAHLAPNYVADTIRAHFPTLGIDDDGAVVPLRLPRKRAPTNPATARERA